MWVAHGCGVHCDCRTLPNAQQDLYVYCGSLGFALWVTWFGVLCHVFVGVVCFCFCVCGCVCWHRPGINALGVITEL